MFKSRLLAACLALSLSTIACCSKSNPDAPAKTTEGNPSKQQTGSADLQGDVKINGSSTVAPISLAAANRFKDGFPNVNVSVGGKGTGDGFKMFIAGEIDISDASRPIKPGEMEECAKAGIEFIEIPVAYDGLSIVVNKETDWVDQITVAELTTIFSAEAKPAKWNEVNPTWPDMELKIFAPGEESGTYDYFKEVTLGKAQMRGDYSANANDSTLVSNIAGTKGSIGYFGASYYFTNKDRLKVLKVVNPAGQPVEPTPETIESGEYAPFSRPLFIYVNKASLKKPQVRVFVEEYLAHAPELAAKVKYVALPNSVYDLAKEHVKKRLTGTHYLTADGKPREGGIVEIYKVENLPSKE